MKRAPHIFTGVNVAALCLYIFFARRIQTQIQMEERPSDIGDGFNYLFTAFPVLVGAGIWNGLWALLALDRIDRRRYGLPVCWLVCMAVWVATYLLFPHLGWPYP